MYTYAYIYIYIYIERERDVYTSWLALPLSWLLLLL